MPIVRATPDDTYWDGGYSRMSVGGAIESYLAESLERQGLSLTIMIVKSDGVTPTAVNPPAMTAEPICGPQTVAACLCTRGVSSPSSYLYLPHDDAIFQHGLAAVLSPFPRPAWEDRKPIAFWRGGASGVERPSLRTRVAKCLVDHPHADVRITPWGGWENGQEISPDLFAPRCDPSAFFQHKYVLIVDGNCIASSHQWTFGTGAVPILVSHPDNVFWFQRYLTPWVHYVPIRYDLSDLRETLDWLVSHDAEAKAIAEAASKLADRVFSPEGQRTYIDEVLASHARTTLTGDR